MFFDHDPDSEKLARELVVKYFNQNVTKETDPHIWFKDTRVVSHIRVLQNWKILIQTIIGNDHYEVVYNGDNRVIYFSVFALTETRRIEERTPETDADIMSKRPPNIGYAMVEDRTTNMSSEFGVSL